jgi:tetratricopeptide (TPR) repeat protein
MGVTSQTPSGAPANRPFAGHQVAVLGRLRVLSRRELRAVVERLGGTFAPQLTPRTTIAVVADRGGVEVPAHVGRVLTEGDVCREAGLPDPDTLQSQYYSSRDLRAMYSALTDDHLRYLERCGLLRPVAGRYAFSDLSIVRQAAAEVARGGDLRAWLRAFLAVREGQLVFDFQPERAPARVVALSASTASASRASLPPSRADQLAVANHQLAAKYFLEGAELDDGEDRDLDAAAAAYRRAALFDPQLVPALVNLANIHYERDELVEAEALYEKAIRLDADCFEAYFNLGNIHHDLGRYKEAVSAYRDALAINGAYPEAHFYLAVTLEKLGRSEEARPHWREYRALAPDGEFAELAREFSE